MACNSAIADWLMFTPYLTRCSVTQEGEIDILAKESCCATDENGRYHPSAQAEQRNAGGNTNHD